MTLVAGPSGSGKSTLFPVAKLCTAAFNVDDRAASLHGAYLGIPQATRRQAQLECEAFVRTQIESRASFAVESTLRSRAGLDQAAAARAAGFNTHLIYVCTDDAEENVQRIARRGRLGGHSAPATEIRAIYAASLANFATCRDLFDEADIYDASKRWDGPVCLARLRAGRLHAQSPLPAWMPAAWQQ